MKYYVETPEVWITEFLEPDDLCSGYWISSLTQSWQKGYPDNCTLSWSNYVDLVRRLRFHTSKEILVDVDMMFNEPSIAATISKELHAVGCDGIVVESKRFPKVNSLIPNAMVLSTPDEFCRLINKAKTASPELKVVARIEYLAQLRCPASSAAIGKRAADAGADAIVVHWGGDADTALLKETLVRLKAHGLETGVIPTRYIDQVTDGEFDDLADFSILGNICSSFIRHAFSEQSVESLLSTPPMFEPILDRVSSHEPAGHRTLVVLGAKPDRDGQWLLQDREVLDRFLTLQDKFYKIIFVTGSGMEVPAEASDKLHILHVDNSIGEVDSLSATRELLNTENTTVAYADIDRRALENIDSAGLAFHNDLFAGTLTIKTELLLSILSESNPNETVLQMASRHNINITTID